MSTINPENETLSAAEELIDEDDFVLDEASLNLAGNETEEDDTADEPSPAAASQSVSNAASVAQIAALEAKISGLIAELTTVKEQSEDRKGQYTRLYADFENFRKRTEREKEEAELRITAKILKKILPIVDDFERAQLQIVPKTDGESVIHNSYQSVYKKLSKSLSESGVARMQVLGEVFDPNYHDAITQGESTAYEEGKVMEELQPGYLVGETVIRHALVKVSSGKIAAPNGDAPSSNPSVEVTASEESAN
ncbi:MAG: nucleotide exchange factor GrpE [Pseudanabaena sp. ELA607]